MLSRQNVGIALAFATAAISGVSVFLNSYAVRAFGDATLYTTAKNVLAAVLLASLVVVATRARSAGIGEGLTIPRGWRERVGLTVVGIVGGGLPFVLFFEGLARVSAGDAAMIHKTLVIWIAVLAVVFLRERFTALHAIAIGLLVAGQLLASGGLAAPRLDVGALMILAATLLWSVETVVAKALLRGLSPLTLGTARMGIGSMVLIGVVLGSGRLSGIAAVTPEAWLWVAATGVVLTAYVATWYSALARAQAIDVSAVLVSGAVVTAFLGAGLRAVPLAPLWPGLTATVLGAVVIAVMALRARRSSAQP